MAGFNNGTVDANNWDFTGNAVVVPQVSASGQLPIGTGAPSGAAILVGILTSPLNTLIIGYASPNITIDVNTMGPILVGINVQTGTTPVVATAGAITINGSVVAAGTHPVRTDGTGTSTYTTEIQISQAIASTNATNIGLAAFNSANFTVDANGFVSAIGGGFAWVNVTGTTQTVAASTGYVSDNAGTITFTLPASSTFGDTFRIVGNTGGWILAQNANQQVLFGSGSTTVGATGSLASTNAGDCIELVATNTSASSVWRVDSSMGNITIV